MAVAGTDPAATAEFWTQRESVLDFLAGQLRQRRLALVLGAGVSQGLNLPGWGELVNRLYANKGAPRDPAHGSEAAADEFQATHCRSAKDFAEAVRIAMYQSFATSDLKTMDNSLLHALGALMTASSRGTVPSAITFNFDDVLETFLEDRGFVVRSIHRLPSWNSLADVTVLHIHGLLPIDDKDDRSAGIVFTKSDFDKVIGKAEDLWNQKVLDVLRSNTCLFLGLSGSDQRLLGLLDQAKATHVSRAMAHIHWAVRPTRPGDKLAAEWKARGVAASPVASHDDVPEWLMEICRRAAEQTPGRRRIGKS